MTPTELKCFLALLGQAPSGDRIELGVFRGDTLRHMIHAGITVGVDSFEGMATPTDKDILDGWNPYPTGRLAAQYKPIHGAQLIKGFIPGVLAHVPNGPYAFAHVDLDQYYPTLHALEWLWGCMVPGGIICCDDYFADREWLAGGAINEFAKTHPLTGFIERKAWFIC